MCVNRPYLGTGDQDLDMPFGSIASDISDITVHVITKFNMSAALLMEDKARLAA